MRNNYLMSWFAIDLVSVFPFDFALRVVIGPEVCHYMTQPLVELYGGCMVVLKVS